MNCKMLCGWLGLVDKNWPPDPRALLGLKPGESDLTQIERTVHDRMAKLRCYQLSHPEEATEGMNRVAQAFICLTEEVARKARRKSATIVATAKLPGKSATATLILERKVPPKIPSMAPGKDDTLVLNQTEVDWKNTPPPVRSSTDKSPTITTTAAPYFTPEAHPPSGEVRQIAGGAAGGDAVITPKAEAPPADPPTEILPPVAVAPPSSASVAAPGTDSINVTIELAQQSPEALRGLGTLPAVMDRVDLTRKLLTAWKRVGIYLSRSGKHMTRPAEETEFGRQLHAIFEAIDQFPPILGHPGKPGYRVVAMARLEMTSKMLDMLDESQREILVRDWDAGHRVLISHRQYLRRQFRTLRKRSPLGRVARGVRAFLSDHLGWVALISLLAVAALAWICLSHI